MKCDETRPSCLKCARTGRTCDGYAVTTNVAAIPPALLQITSYSIPFRVPGSQRDRQLLHYFCVRGVKDISGSSSNDFWSRIVLQASQDDIAVRHALVALSSLHLNLIAAEQPAAIDNPLQDALLQYGKALRSLQRRIEQANRKEAEAVQTALVCSVLFYCFESILGNTKTAMSHLDKGLHLLAAHRSDHPQHQDGGERMTAVTAMVSKLDMQATLYNDARAPLLSLVSADERREGFLFSPDSTFADMNEAQSHLVKLQNWLFQLLQDRADAGWSNAAVDDAFVDERGLLLRHFAVWERKLCLLVEEKAAAEMSKASSNVLLCELQTLLIQHQVLQLFLISRLTPDGEAFGVVPDRVARKILDLSESTLQLYRESAGTATSAPAKSRPSSFSSEIGVVAPLFLLAFKCADDTVRQKASSLLASSGRREGLFDAVTMTKLLQRLEEVKLGRQAKTDVLKMGGLSGSSLEDWTADIFNAAPDGVDQVSECLAKS